MEQDTDYMNMRHIKNNTTPPSERETGQETAGGRISITSTHLGIACLIVLIISLAIAIGLRVQGLQMNKECGCSVPLNRTLTFALWKLTELDGKLQKLSEAVLSLCSILGNYSESLCPSGWKIHNQHCYRFSTDTVNWDSAKQQCESQTSHLIIINTEQEQNFIKKSLESNPGDYWIGLTDRESEGNWKWVDGTPVSFTQWYQGKPNNWKGNENCALIRTSGWNDYICSDHFPFICEKRALTCVEAADIEKYCS
ncbi:C-type lectin domain family 4 member E-like [Carcharodon carcharias]|uniref:C-type lectin domain family 4 member E-like n=1 Tax=Carcharodon carcharias TaxID=13397 RepID=UPI001B7F0A93|nr:C-type lectin domain family 4 member E-like [Carcharodon carcharias]